MCGIVGFTGTRPAQGILIEGLSRLEYRGYEDVYKRQGAGAAASRSSSMVRASLNWRASSSIGSRGR